MSLSYIDTKSIILGLLLAILAYMDWKQRRVSNFLILLGLISGLLFGYFSGSFLQTIQSTILVFAFYFLFWVFGGVAEGDVKVLMVIGSFYGFWHTAEYLIVASAFSIVWICCRKFVLRKRIEEIPLVSFLFVSYCFFGIVPVVLGKLV